jgi:hypothetical protein
MKKTVTVMAGLCLLLSAALLLAQGAPKPGPEHERLGFWEGQWKFEGEMKESPMGPGGKISSKDECEWFEGGFAIVCRMEGQNPMGTTKGLGILTYDPSEGVHTYYGINNSGFSVFSKGQVDGDSWIYHSESTVGGKSMKTRVTLKQTSATSYTFKLESSSDGGPWTTFSEGKGTKSGT